MSKILFCFALCAMLFTLCFPAEAQQTKKVYRIGFLVNWRYPVNKEFGKGLRDLGYVEGENFVIEWRFAEGNSDRYA